MRTSMAYALALTLSAAPFVQAADEWQDDWNDDWNEPAGVSATPSPFALRGFVEAAYGQRLHNNSAIRRSATLSELRGQLEVDYIADHWRADFRGDAVYDDVLNQTDLHVRELNIAFSPTDSLDLKVGRQVLTWGTGDYLFLNDPFPKDWQSFFAGRDDEYLKAPSDTVKASWFASSFSVDLAVSVPFTPDTAITGERFSFFSPIAEKNVAPKPHLNPDKPSGSALSTRIATSHNSVEYALYASKGFWPTPVGVNNKGRPNYPELNTLGASLRTPAGSGLFNTEVAWYDSREDSSGRKPNVPNSQLRWLAGYEQEVAGNLTASAQYYLEWTQNHSRMKATAPKPALVQDEYRHVLTTRLTWRTLQQKLTWSLFSFWSPSDKDAYLRPSVAYRLNDSWNIAAGASVFLGDKQHTFFGQHTDNSNAWLRIRFNG